jgi:hypothetical protein
LLRNTMWWRLSVHAVPLKGLLFSIPSPPSAIGPRTYMTNYLASSSIWHWKWRWHFPPKCWQHSIFLCFTNSQKQEHKYKLHQLQCRMWDVRTFMWLDWWRPQFSTANPWTGTFRIQVS